MLALPTFGFSQPIGTLPEIAHNIRLDILCDWIEGSILFHDEVVSKTDIVEILTESGIYNDADMALSIVNEAWNELKRRLRCLKQGSPFSFIRQTIRRTSSWEDNSAHSFCIILSMPQCYRDWSTSLSNGDYHEQGRLFELLTKASIENQFSDWEVHQTGWSRTNVVKLTDVVNEIANRLNEIKGDIEPWESPDGNDAGLDLLCYRPFPDNRVGIPVYLMQCASGKNWIDKLHEPDLNVWTKIIHFAAMPRKAFAIPFALLDDEFRKRCNRINGMLFDRYRILTAVNHDRKWVPSSLETEIVSWITPRLQTLRSYNE